MSLLRDAHEAMTQAVMHENNTGGEARAVVLKIAKMLDVDLTTNPLNGQVWSTENMDRVAVTTRALLSELRAFRWAAEQ